VKKLIQAIRAWFALPGLLGACVDCGRRDTSIADVVAGPKGEPRPVCPACSQARVAAWDAYVAQQAASREPSPLGRLQVIAGEGHRSK
jgi:hypothetical protein